MLIKIPFVLQIDILQHWISLKDLVMLDSAFCNALERFELKEQIYNSISFTVSGLLYTKTSCHALYSKFCLWLKLKNIKNNLIQFTKFVSNQDISSLKFTSQIVLDGLRVDTDTKARICSVINKSKILTYLQISNVVGIDDNFVLSIEKLVLQNLQILDIITNQKLFTNTTFSFISNNCKCLRKLCMTINDRRFVENFPIFESVDCLKLLKQNPNLITLSLACTINHFNNVLTSLNGYSLNLNTIYVFLGSQSTQDDFQSFIQSHCKLRTLQTYNWCYQSNRNGNSLNLCPNENNEQFILPDDFFQKWTNFHNISLVKCVYSSRLIDSLINSASKLKNVTITDNSVQISFHQLQCILKTTNLIHLWLSPCNYTVMELGSLFSSKNTATLTHIRMDLCVNMTELVASSIMNVSLKLKQFAVSGSKMVLSRKAVDALLKRKVLYSVK
jgi:hypothetical protein